MIQNTMIKLKEWRYGNNMITRIMTDGTKRHANGWREYPAGYPELDYYCNGIWFISVPADMKGADKMAINRV